MNLLFDLDGTLTDPAEGITKSFNYALAKFNLPMQEPAYLERFIGASLKETCCVLLNTDDSKTLAQAVDWYRERYFVEGWLENAVYAGIPELLRACLVPGIGYMWQHRSGRTSRNACWRISSSLPILQPSMAVMWT